LIIADTMGITMFLKLGPTFLMRDLIFFLILGLIVFIGFFYILRNFKTKDSPVRG
jgi:hypothetical protein